MPSRDQILTVAQMRAGEEALIAQGTSVAALMDIAGRGAAEYVWRMAAKARVTVLCGPGNNGGDGYVIAETLRARGGRVAVIPVLPPATPAARRAASLYAGESLGADAERHGEVLVDCLFGSGLTRKLSDDHARLLSRLAAAHRRRIAVDMPSGIESDSGACLADGLPHFDCTIALGAWKQAHFLMPATALMGRLALVDIGVASVPGAAEVIRRPHLSPPPPDAHKYSRGLLAVVAGTMPGATLLACIAAQGAGAGYVKLLSERAPSSVPHDLVVETGALAERLADRRIGAALVGPGLGRSQDAGARLAAVLAHPTPAVLDADALTLLTSPVLGGRAAATIATPHEGELATLERAWGLVGKAPKPARALALARASGMVIVAKGPDTVIAAPDGRLALLSPSSSWLSTAGTGDVLAGTIAARLATGCQPFEAACEGVWLHAEAAWLTPAPFTAGQLAQHIAAAFRVAL